MIHQHDYNLVPIFISINHRRNVVFIAMDDCPSVGISMSIDDICDIETWLDTHATFIPCDDSYRDDYTVGDAQHIREFHLSEFEEQPIE